MNCSLFKSAATGLFLLCLLMPFSLQAETRIDSISLYEKRIKKYESGWKKLIPQYQKVQFAGSIGLVSIGTGWAYCNNKLETDILLGFLPKYQDKRAKLTFTIREQYIPWSLNIGETNWKMEPLTCGLFMNTILDGRFWETEPGGKYPSNYYNFSTKIRFHIFVGQQVTYKFSKKKSLHKSISFYYQLSSCDLYIVSAVQNSYLKPTDYLSLAFGLKFNLL